MPNYRMDRTGEDIMRELTAILRTVKDPRVTGLISVTAVDTTPDLKFCKLYISVLDKSDVNQVLKGLKSAGGYLRRELGSALNLRYTPELQWALDDSITYGAKMLKLINSLEVKEDGNDDNS